MIKFLQNFSFFGGLAIVLLGVIIILITNDTGYEPKLLIKITTMMVFVFGISIFLMLYIRSKGNKR